MTTQLGVFTFSVPSDKRRKRNKGRKEIRTKEREKERKRKSGHSVKLA